MVLCFLPTPPWCKACVLPTQICVTLSSTWIWTGKKTNVYRFHKRTPLHIHIFLVQQCPALRVTERKVKTKSGSHSPGCFPAGSPGDSGTLGSKPSPCCGNSLCTSLSFGSSSSPHPQLLSWVWDW